MPKSSPKELRAKRSAPDFWRASQFSARRLKILALSAKNHRNALICTRFRDLASYSAEARGRVGGGSYPLGLPPGFPLPNALAEVAWVANSKTCHTRCIRLSAASLLHTRNPITQLFRFIRPAT